jgi:predicted DNA-binding protein with PD1-like motif
MFSKISNLVLIFTSFLMFSFHSQAGDMNSSMRTYMLRLSPGDDPKVKLQSFVVENNLSAAVILSAVGSLTKAVIRYANDDNATTLTGHFEIVSLSGTLSSTSGSHLHISISDHNGKTLGGHLMDGSAIFTTLEVSIGALPQLEFKREMDPLTTFKELKVYSAKKK